MEVEKNLLEMQKFCGQLEATDGGFFVTEQWLPYSTASGLASTCVLVISPHWKSRTVSY